MVLLVAESLRSEMLGVPELIRAIRPDGPGGRHPVLAIKAATLTLKYLVRCGGLDLVLMRLRNDCLMYAAQIDEAGEAAWVWSVAEDERELTALRALLDAGRGQVALFNELAVNLAGRQATVVGSDNGALDGATPCRCGESAHRDEVRERFGDWARHATVLSVEWESEWNHVLASYVTGELKASLLSFESTNEGEQQEQAALWLTDALLANRGAVASPQVRKGPGLRELTDVLLPHANGNILIESKTLSVFARPTLPSRARLSADLDGHVRKAVRQLTGAASMVRAGAQIFDAKGDALDVAHDGWLHAIVLVPDLSLLADATALGGAFLRTAAAQLKGLVHILDPAELLRVVQAAVMLGSHFGVDLMDALDDYLTRRFALAQHQQTPYLQVLLRDSTS